VFTEVLDGVYDQEEQQAKSPVSIEKKSKKGKKKRRTKELVSV
jgi:hypothetical protein